MLPLLAVDTSCRESRAALMLPSPGAAADGDAVEKSLPEDDSTAGGSSERLAGLVEELLQERGVAPADLKCLVVGAGPGSFTGLRIGFSFMKGFALASRRSLISFPSLAAYAFEFRTSARLICSVADARRGEYFCAVYTPDDKGGISELTAPSIVAQDALLDLLMSAQKRYSARDEEIVVASVLSEENPCLPFRCCVPQHAAVGLCNLAVRAGKELLFNIEDLAECSPRYLRAVAAKTIAERERESRGGVLTR